VIPATEQFLDPEWVAYHLPDFQEACAADANCAKMGWSWSVCMEQAVIDVAGARECLKALPADAFSTAYAASNGNSLTNSLHWLATRPQQSRKLTSVLYP
ncbi:unnamed protein product, partial [Polarella glacialis]